MSGIYVSEPDLSTAWLETILAVSGQPDRKAFHTITRVLDASLPEIPVIRAAADAVLSEVDRPSVRTVANTIFPAALALQTPEPAALAARYVSLYPSLKAVEPQKNSRGTYFLRLVAYPSVSGAVNQLSHLIQSLKTELNNDRSKRARYETVLADTENHTVATPIFEPSNDTSAMAFPCLSLLSFQLDGGKLHAVAHYRSQYLTERGYGNYLGIAGLLCYVAGQAGISAGALTIVAGHAHADKMTQRRIARLRDLSSGVE